MTDVLVCIKRVPEATGEVTLTPDGLGIDGSHAGYTVSPNEECAVELAVQVADGGRCTVLTLGPAGAVDQLRAALAVGMTDGIHIEGDSDAFGPADVAREVAAAVRARGEAGSAYDLVLLGNDAADTGDFQVGVRLAYALGYPVVTGIQTVSVEGSTAILTGEGPDGSETYRVALPAVVTVLEGGVEPRYPSVMGRMKAKKAPIETLKPTTVPVGSGRLALEVPPPPPNQVRILGEGAAAAPAFVATLAELGVLR
jgi:electron transfer flavoprotein beta subunit